MAREGYSASLIHSETADIQNIVNMVLKSPIRRGSRVVEADGKISMEELSQANTTVATRIVAQMAFNAARGDVKSAEFIFRYGGISPARNQDVLLDAPIIINDMDNRLEPVPPSPLALVGRPEEE